MAYFFDPELIGSLPCQDYLFKLEDVTNISLTCGFVIQQSGQKEISIDLKVPLGKSKYSTDSNSFVNLVINFIIKY